MDFRRIALPLCALATLAVAVPAPNPAPVPHPMITPAPVLRRDYQRRSLDPASYVESLVSGLGSDVSSYIASGIPQYFQDFPVGDSVESSLGISSDDLKATPTQVLNIP